MEPGRGRRRSYRGAAIDPSTGSVSELSPCAPDEIAPAVAPLVIPGEQFIASVTAVRDLLVLTDERLITGYVR